MKRLILATFFLLCLLTAIPQSYAIVTHNVDSLTGGAQRSLDYISVGDLNNGDRALAVYESGTSDYYLYFKYDSSGTTAEQTSTHPYYIRPDDYATGGVWFEVSPDWAHLAGPLENLTVTNLTVTHEFVTNATGYQGNYSRITSGARPIIAHTSGTSLVALGTFVYHSGTGSSVYGLPAIPTSGVSTPYVMFACGPSGGGITIYNTGGQPFLGESLSGTSYLALPPGNPMESATLFGVVDESGTSPYWFVQKSSSWVAGN